METNIREVSFSSSYTEHLYGFAQYDRGQKLKITGIETDANTEVHFSLSASGGESPRVLPDSTGAETIVSVPDFVFRADRTYDYEAYAFVCYSDVNVGKTERRIIMHIKSRPKPADLAPPSEPDLTQKVLQELSTKLTAPSSAQVGQIFRVQSINEDGTLVLEAVDMPSGGGTDVTVDTTLSVSGQAADAKATGDAISLLSEEIADLPQADWNQNDETAADFVKNRPFYSETGNVTVENAVEVELNRFPVFEVGDTVTVNVDGVEHSLVAYDDDGDAAIGDTYSSIENGEWQLGWNIFVDVDEVYFYATEAHTVSYLGIRRHKLDKKYMPDEVLDGICEAQIAANDAQITANDAQTAANEAQIAANEAQITANNARTAANNAQITANGKVNVISRDIIIYDTLDVLDIQVGETFAVTKEGYMTDGTFKRGDIVIISLQIIDRNAGRSEGRKIIANAVDAYTVDGITMWYDINNQSVIKVYAVHLKNVQNTSTLSLVRLG